jgi:hypothetical protein
MKKSPVYQPGFFLIGNDGVLALKLLQAEKACQDRLALAVSL